MKNKPHKLWVLFLTTLYISAFTFGGGFVIVTFMKHKFVDELHWIDEQEMLDFTALAQSCPGAIAVNAAILVGWNVYGFAGMIVATLGTILPPMIIGYRFSSRAVFGWILFELNSGCEDLRERAEVFCLLSEYCR